MAVVHYRLSRTIVGLSKCVAPAVGSGVWPLTTASSVDHSRKVLRARLSLGLLLTLSGHSDCCSSRENLWLQRKWPLSMPIDSIRRSWLGSHRQTIAVELPFHIRGIRCFCIGAIKSLRHDLAPWRHRTAVVERQLFWRVRCSV